MEKLRTKLRKKGGFTLIEMLIVVAIIAILIAVSIPMVSGALDKAKKATDAANVRAARAEMSIAFLTEEVGEDVVMAYDAAKGKIVDDAADITTAYRKEVNPTTDVVFVVVVDNTVCWQWASKAGTAPDAPTDLDTLGTWKIDVPTVD